MAYQTREVHSESEKREFLLLPFRIYRGNRTWVPLLPDDARAQISEAANPLLKKCECLMLMAYDGQTPAARMLVGVDPKLNRTAGFSRGFFTLFECVDDVTAAQSLFSAGAEWLRQRGVNELWGPLEPTGGDIDEYKGILAEGYEYPQVIMTSYNPPYYTRLMEECGFQKERDVYAYIIHRKDIHIDGMDKRVEWAEKRFGYRVNTIDMRRLDHELKDIVSIMEDCFAGRETDGAAGDEVLFDVMVPQLEDLLVPAEQLLKNCDPNLIRIARVDGRPVGFSLGMPDYNMATRHMKGREGLMPSLKYKYYKNKIYRYRFFTVFVTPDHRAKGVLASLLFHTTNYLLAHNRDLEIEFSHIRESNKPMRSATEHLGFTRYKTFRIYIKSV
jgi:hypothetical protein